jgi:hypothetical protein
MQNEDLADELIERLNTLCENQEARAVLGKLLNARVAGSEGLFDHPTIQVRRSGDLPEVGFLGMLNGLVGVIPSGKFEGWGYITVQVDDDDSISRFERTDVPESRPFDEAKSR